MCSNLMMIGWDFVSNFIMIVGQFNMLRKFIVYILQRRCSFIGRNYL